MKNYRTPAIGYFIATLGALFYCYEYFLRVSPGVMEPQLMRSFNIDATLFGTLSACYYYAYTPMQLFVGLIVDRFRVRRVLILAILACALGSFLMASSHDYMVAAAGRFLQGFGSAFAFVGTLKLVALWLPSNRFAFFSGLAASLGFLGAAMTQIILTYIVAFYNWRTAIQIFTALGLILAVLFWITLYSKKRARVIDYPKRSIVYNLKNLWKIVKMPGMWMSGIYSYFMFLPTSVFGDLWGIPYMKVLHHYLAEQAAIAVSMVFIGWAVGSALMGWISDRFKTRSIVMRVGSLVAFVLSLVLLYVSHLPFVWVCILFVLFGTFSAAQALTFAMARDLCHSNVMVGSAVAFINMVCMLGGVIFERGLGQILDWTWDGTMQNGIRVYSLHSYEIAMSVIPISIGLAFLLSLGMKNSYVENIR